MAPGEGLLEPVQETSGRIDLIVLLALGDKCVRARRAAELLPWGLTSQPCSPKRLGHRVASNGHGIASACTRLGGSETFLRSRWAKFGACCRRPRCRGFIEPHRQRDPPAFRLDLQHFDTDNIAGLR